MIKHLPKKGNSFFQRTSTFYLFIQNECGTLEAGLEEIHSIIP